MKAGMLLSHVWSKKWRHQCKRKLCIQLIHKSVQLYWLMSFQFEWSVGILGFFLICDYFLRKQSFVWLCMLHEVTHYWSVRQKNISLVSAQQLPVKIKLWPIPYTIMKVQLNRYKWRPWADVYCSLTYISFSTVYRKTVIYKCLSLLFPFLLWVWSYSWGTRHKVLFIKKLKQMTWVYIYG